MISDLADYLIKLIYKRKLKWLVKEAYLSSSINAIGLTIAFLDPKQFEGVPPKIKSNISLSTSFDNAFDLLKQLRNFNDSISESESIKAFEYQPITSKTFLDFMLTEDDRVLSITSFIEELKKYYSSIKKHYLNLEGSVNQGHYERNIISINKDILEILKALAIIKNNI